MIGGEATGGNDPTNDTFVRPPLGNLISGNNANGVLINNGANANQLSGNFIGTTASGNAALGNSADGVAIVNASSNSLLGCLFVQNPFVFYNVISGNGGNGLRVTNSNDTTIQANFFGMNADNDAALGNAQNGVLVEGSSTRTTMGGPIPLGNVDSANGQNGIYVKDSASYFISYNTFCGLAAFSELPYFGNHKDGILITSTGGNNLLRTNVVTENYDDGVEISGSARDVRVTGNIIGMDTNGAVPMSNRDNGVEVGGNASDIVIGGPQPTFNLIPHNVISANYGNGVAIVGTAHNITVSAGVIGTDLAGEVGYGNFHDGVYLGPGTYSNTIGSSDPALQTLISANGVNGIELNGTRNNTVFATWVGTDILGNAPLGNASNGVLITNGSNDNLIGGQTDALRNILAYNGGNGVFVESGVRDRISQNSIFFNSLLSIDLAAGANNNQAAPVLTSVQPVGGGIITINGTLTSTPDTNFTIELFASQAGYGWGQFYLGFVTVRTNRFGVATVTYIGGGGPSGYDFFTATATDPINNTSELSNVVS